MALAAAKRLEDEVQRLAYRVAELEADRVALKNRAGGGRGVRRGREGVAAVARHPVAARPRGPEVVSDDAELERLRVEARRLRDLVRALSAALARAAAALPPEAALALARGGDADTEPPFRLEHWNETIEMTRADVAPGARAPLEAPPPAGEPLDLPGSAAGDARRPLLEPLGSDAPLPRDPEGAHGPRARRGPRRGQRLDGRDARASSRNSRGSASSRTRRTSVTCAGTTPGSRPRRRIPTSSS